MINFIIGMIVGAFFCTVAVIFLAVLSDNES